MSLLVDDVLVLIFGYLEPADLGNISRVCHEWNALASSNDVWRFLFKREGLYVPISDESLKEEYKEGVHGWVKNTYSECIVNSAHLRGVRSIVIDSSCALALSASDAGDIALWNLTKQLQHTKWAHMRTVHRLKGINSLRIVPDSSTCVSCDDDGVLCHTDYAATQRIFSRPVEEKSTTRCRVCCPIDRNTVLVGTDAGLLFLHDLRSPASSSCKSSMQSSSVASMAWCATDNIMAIGQFRGTCCLWDARTRTVLHEMPEQEDDIWQVMWREPDAAVPQRRLMTGNGQGWIRQWEYNAKDSMVDATPVRTWQMPDCVYGLTMAGKNIVVGGKNFLDWFREEETREPTDTPKWSNSDQSPVWALAVYGSQLVHGDLACTMRFMRFGRASDSVTVEHERHELSKEDVERLDPYPE